MPAGVPQQLTFLPLLPSAATSMARKQIACYATSRVLLGMVMAKVSPKHFGRSLSQDVLPFARYVVIGLSQNAFFYVAGLVLIRFGLSGGSAIAVLYPVATTVSFVANRRWSFGQRRRTPAALGRYVAVYVLAYPAAILLTRTQEMFGVPAWLALLATMGVLLFAIFAALNLWVFRDQAKLGPSVRAAEHAGGNLT